ncbi:MAG: hypothetical protein WC635_00050 [Bacteriovorax sp.]|jgi:lipoyl(octanoyl) transferase
MVDLSLFEKRSENIFILKKWNWDYLEAEKFQLECVDFVNKNPHVVLLIICSHPHCFTIGRGLQKSKESSSIELVDFNHETELPYPLYQIKRGGGLTFHYPGQIVFYPIVNLTHQKKAVFDLMLKILEITQDLLETQFGFDQLQIKRELLGLWFENSFSSAKIASIGLAVSRFNTYHGLALNFFNDDEMFKALCSLYPCGLPGDVYKSIEFLLCEKIPEHRRESFTEDFLEKFLQYLKPDRQDQYMTDKQRSSSLISNSIS